MKRFVSMIIILSTFSISCTKYEQYEFYDYTKPFQKEKFTDSRDGQSYDYVKIGESYWMAENLNYKILNSFVYNDDEVYANIYGRFYNWETACSVCPNGWHLPSNEEVSALLGYLGGGDFAGAQMKETGDEHWNSPNIDASNISGFTALPAGIYLEQGYAYGLGEFGEWWTSTSEGVDFASEFDLAYDRGYCQQTYTWKTHRLSIRCIKNTK
jgi:uncharacterized protein (TIGR02145 family)